MDGESCFKTELLEATIKNSDIFHAFAAYLTVCIP